MHINDESIADKTGYLIGVFMNPFNVHYNRTPITGHINKISHDFPNSKNCDRKNRGMLNSISNLFFDEKPYWKACDYIIHNERASYTIKNNDTTLYMTQIADSWTKKIINYKDNEQVKQGEIFGLIRMGSQVDIFVPDCDKYELNVQEGQKVKAGQSVLLKKKYPPLNPPGLRGELKGKFFHYLFPAKAGSVTLQKVMPLRRNSEPGTVQITEPFHSMLLEQFRIIILFFSYHHFRHDVHPAPLVCETRPK